MDAATLIELARPMAGCDTPAPLQTKCSLLQTYSTAMLLIRAFALLVAATAASPIAEPVPEPATVNPTSVFCAVVTGLVTKAKAQPQATSFCSSYLSIKTSVLTKRIIVPRYLSTLWTVQVCNYTNYHGPVIRLPRWSPSQRQQSRQRISSTRTPLPLSKPDTSTQSPLNMPRYLTPDLGASLPPALAARPSQNAL